MVIIVVYKVYSGVKLMTDFHLPTAYIKSSEKMRASPQSGSFVNHPDHIYKIMQIPPPHTHKIQYK